MLTAMSGVRRVVPVTLGLIDLPESILVQDGSDRELRVPVPGVLVQCDGGWLLLDTGFNTALINDPALHARFHGDPVMRPVIPGPGEPLDEALDGAGIDIADIHAVAVSHLHWDHAGGLRHFAGRVPVHAQRAEYDYATQPGPVPEQHGMFRIDYDDPRIDWRFAAGDVELAPGVTAVLTAGHTPGHQSFVVDLAGGGPRRPDRRPPRARRGPDPAAQAARGRARLPAHPRPRPGRLAGPHRRPHRVAKTESRPSRD
jgi:N-acyl homoserine lactone hydrolase